MYIYVYTVYTRSYVHAVFNVCVATTIEDLLLASEQLYGFVNTIQYNNCDQC